MEQLKEAYKSNLRQYVNHTTVQPHGQISKITVNVLNKSGFYEQVEAALQKIGNICRYMVPYNLLLAFGFLLYKMRTNEIEQYFIVDHLQRDLERRSLGRFRSSTSTSTSFQLRNRSTHIQRESLSQLVLEAAVQYEFLIKSRTEQNEFGIDNISKNKCTIHKQLPR